MKMKMNNENTARIVGAIVAVGYFSVNCAGDSCNTSDVKRERLFTGLAISAATYGAIHIGLSVLGIKL